MSHLQNKRVYVIFRRGSHSWEVSLWMNKFLLKVEKKKSQSRLQSSSKTSHQSLVGSLFQLLLHTPSDYTNITDCCLPSRCTRLLLLFEEFKLHLTSFRVSVHHTAQNENVNENSHPAMALGHKSAAGGALHSFEVGGGFILII